MFNVMLGVSLDVTSLDIDMVWRQSREGGVVTPIMERLQGFEREKSSVRSARSSYYILGP
jgi:hypothetical protein